MGFFSNDGINFDALKRKAFNYRWAEVPEGVIPLTAADPDFPSAPEIRKAMIDYLEDGYLSYTPKLGLPEFRQSIARSLRERKGEPVDPELVLPIDSAARGMYVIAQTVLEPGDEVLVFDPVDYLFKQSTLAAGGVPVLYPARLKADGSGIDLSDLEDYITPRTKMIGFCNPHNPLGMVYSREDLEHLLEVANRHDLWIMNDEIWSDIVYPEKPFVSLLNLEPEKNRKTLSVFGFSKSFGVAGLRIGCIYVNNQEIFDRIVEESAVMTTAGGLPSISQVAGIACLDQSYYWVEEFLEHLVGNRDYICERLNAMKGITCHKPQATYMVFPDITGTGMTSEAFEAFMLEHVKLAIVPGTDKFFGPGAEGHVRICFATSREVLEEGLNRLEKGLSIYYGK